MILRLASHLKIADFGRKCAISQPLLDMRPALRAGLSGGSSLGQRPATLFILGLAEIDSIRIEHVFHQSNSWCEKRRAQAPAVGALEGRTRPGRSRAKTADGGRTRPGRGGSGARSAT